MDPKNKLRILQLTSHLGVGGVPRYVLTLSEALHKRGHSVAIASDGGLWETEPERRGCAFWRVGLNTSAEFGPKARRAATLLTERLKSAPVDIIHAHTRVAQVVASRIASRTRIPFVTTWHGFFRTNLGRKFWPCAGERVIAISEPVRRHLVEDFCVPNDDIRLIPNGVDVDAFRLTPTDEMRAALGLPKSGPVIGTVSRLVPAKGVDVLIRAFALLRRDFPDILLLIVGDGEDRVRLETLARQENIAQAVFFTGSLPQTNRTLAIMDIFVFLPADKEGFGLSFLEAMAAARPIVAVRRGQGAEWVLKEAGCAQLVGPDNPLVLADSLRDLLQHPDKARAFGHQARGVAEQRFNLARMAQAVESVYREVLAAGAGARRRS